MTIRLWKSLVLLSLLLLLWYVTPSPVAAQGSSDPYPLPWYITTTRPTATHQGPAQTYPIAASHDTGEVTKVCAPVPGPCRGVARTCAWWWRCDGLGFLYPHDFDILHPANESTWTTVLTTQDNALTTDSPLHAPPRTNAQRVVDYLDAQSRTRSRAEITEIVDAYWHTSRQSGLDPLLVLAQLAHETGNLDSWWSQPPRNNPAGIGVTGDKRRYRPPYGAWHWDGSSWREGLSFDSWDAAAQAHVGRLLAYAMTDDGDSVQQALIATALQRRPLPSRYRGVGKTLKDYGDGVWATDPHYAEKWLRKAREMQLWGN